LVSGVLRPVSRLGGVLRPANRVNLVKYRI